MTRLGQNRYGRGTTGDVLPCLLHTVIGWRRQIALGGRAVFYFCNDIESGESQGYERLVEVRR
jgi:hypothetical protein